jgi:hypothetical protein
MHYLAFKMPGGNEELLFIYITLFLGTLAGMLTGLFASSISPNSGSAPLITIMLILPCVVLSGALVQLPEAVSAPSISYWSFKALVAISGVGSDPASDACWEIPPVLRQSMTLEDKTALGCQCMGLNAFKPDLCNFPGNGKYSVPELNQPQPASPAPPGDPPGEPDFGAPPDSPADSYDKVQVAAYLNALQQYQSDVARKRDTYKQNFDLYQNQVEIYQAQMKVFQAENARWYVARAAAIGSAEGNIKGFLDRFGWAFVNKENRSSYMGLLTSCWNAQGIIILGLFLGILITMKVKDR